MSAQETPQETKLARALVHLDKQVRDDTIATLGSYLGSRKTFTEMEMLKLWRAMYFCMWLADKQPVQLELIGHLVGFLGAFKKDEITILYFRIFLRTILREWARLDQYRVNKFYSLIRHMIRGVFEHLKSKRWAEKMVLSAMEALQDEILSMRPNGPRYHVADLYLEELYKVTDGALDSSTFLLLLQPFILGLKTTSDKSYFERIQKSIFQSYLETYAPENAVNLSSSSSAIAPAATVFSSNVSTAALQQAIFIVAGDKDTNEANRRKLYDLNKSLVLKCKPKKQKERSASSKENGEHTRQSENSHGSDSFMSPSKGILKENTKKRRMSSDGSHDEQDRRVRWDFTERMSSPDGAYRNKELPSGDRSGQKKKKTKKRRN
jgi:ribosomal RNA-processing protein 1